MNDPIKEAIRFQTERNLHEQEYDPLNEATSVIEEVCESFGFNTPKDQREYLKGAINDFIKVLATAEIIVPMGDPLTLNDAVDSHCDQIELNIGAILKLGFSPSDAILEMTKEINSRKGSIQDGKFVKDTSPEAKTKWYKADYSKCKLLVDEN